MSYLKCLLILLIGFSTITLYAQEENFLRGRVYETTSNTPIVYATVRIKGKTKGVITNMDGGFRLPKNLYQMVDTIQVSSMGGYQLTNFPISKLSPSEINILRLPTTLFSLDEAVVSAKRKKRLTARQILKRAIENITLNYPMFSFSTKGYYREYQVDSIGYINLNEAFVEVFDIGFHKIDTISTKISMYDYVRNTDFPRDTVSDNSYNYEKGTKVIDKAYLSAYGGNEFAILRIHNAIRNYKLSSYDFINSLAEGDVIKNHSIERKLDTYADEERLFAIHLKKKFPGYTARGMFYISQQDFAIHKIHYSLYDDYKRNSDKELRDTGIIGSLIFEVNTEYRRGGRNDKMYLNYNAFRNTFQLALPPKFIVDSLQIMDQNKIMVYFNNDLGKESKADDLKNYKFSYRGEIIKPTNVKVYTDRCLLEVKASAKLWNNLNGELNTRTNKGVSGADVFLVQIEDILDNEGNILNEYIFKDYTQFREFFTQEIGAVSRIPVDSLLMDMRRPIFDNQPVNRPDNYKSYWMNTPFKPLE